MDGYIGGYIGVYVRVLAEHRITIEDEQGQWDTCRRSMLDLIHKAPIVLP